MKRPQLRWLILVPIVATVTIGLIAFSIYVDRYVRQELIESVDDELIRAQQVGLAGRSAPPGLDRRDPAGLGQQLNTISPPIELVLSPTGQILEEAGGSNPFDELVLLEIAALPDGQYTFDDPAYRVQTTKIPNSDVLVTALDLSSVNALLTNLRRALVVGSTVILLLQAIIVWLITSYLTRPLTKMTESARRIAGGELDIAIGEPGGSQETAGLAVDLNRMLDQLHTTLDSSERSAAEARQARNEMEQFLADASHELRTPLTALKGYSDLYHGDMLANPEDLDRAMGRIGSESERMTRLVSDMLQLARTGQVNANPLAAVDLGLLLIDVVADLRAAYPTVHIATDTTTDQMHVFADRDQLHQAILNIASNASNYAGEHRDGLHIELHRTGHNATIRVIDHGPGIDPALAEQIFLPFFRADESRSRKGVEGSGLGLAITKRIVDSYDGDIQVEQTPGGGATFVVTLPIRDERNR